MVSIQRFASQRWWTLHRFGFTPSKILNRYSNKNEPKILCISIPKSGTHLLERALCLHPRLYRKTLPTIKEQNIVKWGDLSTLLQGLQPGQIMVSHLFFTPERLQSIEKHAIRPILLVRDPRDIVISQAFHDLVRMSQNHPLRELYMSRVEFKDKLRLQLEGCTSHGLLPLSERLDRFAGWLTSGCLIIRFEDLIGTRGGGDKAKQLEVLRSIYSFVGMEVDDEWISHLCSELFSSSSPTFRKGNIGQWKQYFDSDLIHLFNKMAGQTLIKYGYTMI